MITRIFKPDQAKECAEIIRNGGLLAIPTETVYGLGANGLDPDAVRRIFKAKGRPQDNPLILHVPDESWLDRYCYDIPADAYKITETYWPGPVTLILKAKNSIPKETTAGLNTVGVRCPRNSVTRKIISLAGVPIAAPSANTSGRPSCTTASDVLEDMEGKIDGIVDDGPCEVGVESTIVDLTVRPYRLLRPGGLPLEELRKLLGQVVVDEAVTHPMSAAEHPRAPGMKYRHYAPKAPVTAVYGNPDLTAAYISEHLKSDEGVICFNEYARQMKCALLVETIGEYKDQKKQAQSIFDALRSFDHVAVSHIWAQCPSKQGLGLAVLNRIEKAAGFHIVELQS